MKLKRTLVLMCFFIVIFCPFYVNAWDKVEVHPILSENAIIKSILDNQFLEKNLDLSRGLNESVNGKLLHEWHLAFRRLASLPTAGRLIMPSIAEAAQKQSRERISPTSAHSRIH